MNRNKVRFFYALYEGREFIRDEYSVLWVDTMSQLNEDGTLAVNEDGETITPYDYIVKKVAKSLNVVSVAVSKVSVSD